MNKSAINHIYYCSCPQCDVMFKFTSDKLELSAGMVKCGVCRKIFDARSHLLVKSDSGYMPFKFTDQISATGIPEKQVGFLREFSEPIHLDADSESELEEASENDTDSEWFESTITILNSITAVFSGYDSNWIDQPLYKAIKPFLNFGRTGTAIVVFTDLSVAKIYIDSGEPISARHGGAQGTNAFRSWGDLKVMTAEFHENQDLVYSDKNLDSIINL